ncbi:hypothetical protein DENSPDRAFT_506475 [Dentipellis sp. KUC8613]|nr:hypothetical protein DENSPDRAFT_506475 [Dentipellis sp. KUC8613]
MADCRPPACMATDILSRSDTCKYGRIHRCDRCKHISLHLGIASTCQERRPRRRGNRAHLCYVAPTVTRHHHIAVQIASCRSRAPVELNRDGKYSFYSTAGTRRDDAKGGGPQIVALQHSTPSVVVVATCISRMAPTAIGRFKNLEGLKVEGLQLCYWRMMRFIRET